MLGDLFSIHKYKRKKGRSVSNSSGLAALPVDLLLEIARFLSVFDLLSLTQVCRGLRTAITELRTMWTYAFDFDIFGSYSLQTSPMAAVQKAVLLDKAWNRRRPLPKKASSVGNVGCEDLRKSVVLCRNSRHVLVVGADIVTLHQIPSMTPYKRDWHHGKLFGEVTSLPSEVLESFSSARQTILAWGFEETEDGPNVAIWTSSGLEILKFSYGSAPTTLSSFSLDFPQDTGRIHLQGNFVVASVRANRAEDLLIVNWRTRSVLKIPIFNDNHNQFTKTCAFVCEMKKTILIACATYYHVHVINVAMPNLRPGARIVMSHPVDWKSTWPYWHILFWPFKTVQILPDPVDRLTRFLVVATTAKGIYTSRFAITHPGSGGLRHLSSVVYTTRAPQEAIYGFAFGKNNLSGAVLIYRYLRNPGSSSVPQLRLVPMRCPSAPSIFKGGRAENMVVDLCSHEIPERLCRQIGMGEWRLRQFDYDPVEGVVALGNQDGTVTILQY